MKVKALFTHEILLPKLQNSVPRKIFFQPIISTGDQELTVCEHPNPLTTWNIVIC